jgi:uncharacterized protein DUF2809
LSTSKRVLYLGATLIGAVFVLVYRGPLWPVIRSYGGDWLVVQFIYLMARFRIRFGWRFYLAGAVLLLGLLVEIIQLYAAGSIPRSFAAEITIGSTFDPLDILAYALGLATVLIVEQRESKLELA